MGKEEISQKIGEGWILARVILEMVGKPKKHVDDTLGKYLEVIGKNQNLKIVKQKTGKAKKLQGDLFSSFAEAEIMFKDMNNMVYFCFDYMPSSVEVIEPQETTYKAQNITSFINDLQARLHNVDMAAKTLKQHNIKLNENFTKILKNFMAVSCINKKTMDELEKIIGMDKRYLEKVAEILIKEQRMKKEGDTYRTVK